MKKKFIIGTAVIILALATFLTYTTVRDKITEKIMTNILKNDKSLQQQLESAAEAAESQGFTEKGDQTSPEETPGSTTDEQKEAEQSTQQNENKSSTQSGTKKAGSFWDDPFVKSVYSRFSSSEIAELSAMSANGYTSEEKARAKSIVYGKVSSGEISRLQQIYNSYSKK